MFLIRKAIVEFKQLNWIIKLFVILALVLGSVFRYNNLFNLGYYFDMVETQYTWGRGAFEQGVFGFWQNYPMSKHYDYPPISLVYEYFVYGFSGLFSGDRVQNFVIILKSVNWFFDVFMSVFLVVFGYFIKGARAGFPNDTYLPGFFNNEFPIKPGMTNTTGDLSVDEPVTLATAGIHKNPTNPEIPDQARNDNSGQGITSTSRPVILNSFQDLKASSSYLNPASIGWVLAGIFYLSPSSWFVSGVWGQNDTLMVLITLICLLILVTRFFNRDGFPFKLGMTDTTSSLNDGPVTLTNTGIHKNLTTGEIPDQARNDSGNTVFTLTNKYFLAGVLLAIGFWIKQQPILVIPILALIFVYNKSNKDILKVISWVSPFILLLIPLAFFYTPESLQFSNNFNFLTKLVGLDYPIITNWGIIANLGMLLIFIVPLSILTYFELKLKTTTVWQDLRRFTLGFWLISTIIAIPSVISNYQRFARVTFASVIRGDSIAVGATTFWGIFEELKTANDLILGFLPLKQAAVIIYLVLFGFVLWRYLELDWKKVKTLDSSRAEGYQSSKALLRTLDLKVIFANKLNLFQLLSLMWVNTSVYFLFFPNMHSRYLHFGIIYSLLVTFFLPLKNRLVGSLWILGLILLNLFYSLNQFLVFGSNNDSPKWVKTSIDWFSTGGRDIDAWWLSSVGLTVSFVLMYSALVKLSLFKSSRL